MATVGDAFEVVHVIQDEDNRLIQNTWFYRYAVIIDPLGDPWSKVLAERFDELKVTAMLTLYNNTYRSVQVRVRNLFDDDDKYVLDHSRVGTSTNLAQSNGRLPSFNAVKWTLNHDKGSIRKGRKFIGGLREGDTENGVFAGFAQYVNHAAVATIMLAPVSTYFIFTQDTFVPIVVKRVEDVQPDGSIRYRLPNVVGELAYGLIKAITPSALVTSMNSRKD